MSETAIKVERLSKRYRIGLKDQMHDTFVGAMKSWLKAPLTSYKQLRKLTKFDDNPSKEQRAKSLTPCSLLHVYPACLVGGKHRTGVESLPREIRSIFHWGEGYSTGA